MESKDAKELLKRRLRQEVARFYERDNRLWKMPVVEMLRELQEANARAVFFGGTLRSLLVSRLFDGRPGRPRDVDIVVSGSSVDSVKELFRERIARETRFGGLQLRHWDWQFDVWPLSKTWAFVNASVLNPEFAALPETTFFNLEAIAVDVWALPGRSREIYSGSDQFFDGVLNRTLEINREENPYPELCVVRALVIAASLDFRVGPRLAAYIVRNGERLTIRDLDEVQAKHYGQRRQDSAALREWIAFVSDRLSHNASEAIRLPLFRQLEFWPESEEQETVRVHALMR